MLTRLALAWFVLMLVVAGVSPIVHPKAMEVVCTVGGAMKIVLTSDDGLTADLGQHTLDCSLCLAATLPLAQPRIRLYRPQPLARALHPLVAAHIAALIGAPLPPRGPPVLV